MREPITRRSALAGMSLAAAGTHFDSAALAQASAQASSNFFGTNQYGSLEAAIAAGEENTAPGQMFAVDDDAGNLLFRVRTAGGSLIVAQTVAAASLNADDGAAKLGWKRSANTLKRQQDLVNRDQPPHLFDVTPGAMHAAILAGTSREDITQFLNDARASAIREGYEVVRLPPGQAVISGTVDLQTGPGSFRGVKFLGPGQESLTLLQALEAPQAEAPLFRMLGGSGKQTNKALSGFSVRPVDTTYNMRGKLLQIEGQCFTFCHDLVADRLHTAIELINRSPNSFTEMNSFHNIRSIDCLRGVSLIRDGGAESFHGNVFFGSCQINIPEGGVGLWLEGRSGVCYYYNAEANFRMFGGSGERCAIRCKNAIVNSVILNVTCEDPCVIQIVDRESCIRSQGRLSSTHPIVFNCTEPGQVIFTNHRNSRNFTDPLIANLSPEVISPALGDGNSNGDFPAIFKITGPNVEALGLAYYDAGGANGIYFGRVQYRETLEEFQPLLRIDSEGSVRFLGGGASSSGVAGGRLRIPAGGTASLPSRARGALLILRDDDLGGVGVYRIDEISGVHLESGDEQFAVGRPVSETFGVTADQSGTFIHTASQSSKNIEYIMIGMIE